MYLALSDTVETVAVGSQINFCTP